MKLREVKDRIKEGKEGINEKKEKLNELLNIKASLAEAKNEITSDSDMDENAKAALEKLLDDAENQNQEQAQNEIKELGVIEKEMQEEQEKTSLAEAATERKMSKLNESNELLKKIGINMLDDALEVSEESLKELKDTDEEIKDQISQIAELSQVFEGI